MGETLGNAVYAGLGEGLCKASTVVDRCVDSQPGGADGCFVVAPDAWEAAFLTARSNPCGGSTDRVYVPGNPSEASRINGLALDDAEAACTSFATLPGPLYEACVSSYSFGAKGVAVASMIEVRCEPVAGRWMVSFPHRHASGFDHSAPLAKTLLLLSWVS